MTVYVDMKGAIALLQSGEWELGYDGEGTCDDGRYWLQQGGLTKGGKSVGVRISTIRALEKRGLVQIAPKEPKQPFWLRRYRWLGDAQTAEKVSEAVSGAESGMDFWVGRIFRSKDSREPWRHVVIADIRNGRAKCHRLLMGEPEKMNSRGSWISLKGLATRWRNCPDVECYCKQNGVEQMTKEQLMVGADLDEDEFDELYAVILDEIRNHGTHGVGLMLKYIEQELTAGREHIE